MLDAHDVSLDGLNASLLKRITRRLPGCLSEVHFPSGGLAGGDVAISAPACIADVFTSPGIWMHVCPVRRADTLQYKPTPMGANGLCISRAPRTGTQFSTAASR
jgi:hypothetical protein